MKKRLIITLLLVVLVTFTTVLSGCSTTKIIEEVVSQVTEANLSVGTWNENVYTNEYFNMTAEISDEWVVLSEDEITEMFGYASDFYDEIGTDAVDLEELVDTAIPLFVLLKYDETGMPTTNIICMCSYAPLATVDASIEQNKQILSEQYAEMGTTTFGETKTKNFGELESKYMNVDTLYNPELTNGAEVYLYQQIFAMKKNGYYIELSTTTTTEDGSDIEEILSTVNFS